LLVWEGAVHVGALPVLLFPAPTVIGSTFVRHALSGSLLTDVGFTLSRWGVGLMIGAIAGIAVGVLMGWSARVRTVMEPFVAAVHPLPKSSLLPLLLVLMGVGDGPRVVLVALAAFFPMLISTMTSVATIDTVHLEAAYNYGARGKQLLTHVILPASLPGIMGGMRIALNSALTIAITAELLTSRNGLGARIWMAWQTFRTVNLYVALAAIGLLGLSANALLGLLSRYAMPWTGITQPDLDE